MSENPRFHLFIGLVIIVAVFLYATTNYADAPAPGDAPHYKTEFPYEDATVLIRPERVGLALGGGKAIVGAAGAAAQLTQWGWRLSKSWHAAVKTVASGGTIRAIAGKVPTRTEAIDLIKAAGGKVIRIEKGHPPPNPHTFPHINYTTPSGAKATIQIQGL